MWGFVCHTVGPVRHIFGRNPLILRDFYAIRTPIVWHILGAYFLQIWGVRVVRIVSNLRFGNAAIVLRLRFFVWSEKLQNDSSQNFQILLRIFPKFWGVFGGNADQKKFTKIPRNFSMQNSQASSKKNSTKIFWRAGKKVIFWDAKTSRQMFMAQSQTPPPLHFHSPPPPLFISHIIWQSGNRLPIVSSLFGPESSQTIAKWCVKWCSQEMVWRWCEGGWGTWVRLCATGHLFRNARLFTILFCSQFLVSLFAILWRVFALLLGVLLTEIQGKIRHFAGWEGGVKGHQNCEQTFCEQTGVSYFQKRKISPKTEVFGQTSLRTSGQKLWSGPPNLEKQAFWHGHAARTSTKKLKNFGLIFRSLPWSSFPWCFEFPWSFQNTKEIPWCFECFRLFLSGFQGVFWCWEGGEKSLVFWVVFLGIYLNTKEKKIRVYLLGR